MNGVNHDGFTPHAGWHVLMFWGRKSVRSESTICIGMIGKKRLQEWCRSGPSYHSQAGEPRLVNQFMKFMLTPEYSLSFTHVFSHCIMHVHLKNILMVKPYFILIKSQSCWFEKRLAGDWFTSSDSLSQQPSFMKIISPYLWCGKPICRSFS